MGIEDSYFQASWGGIRPREKNSDPRPPEVEVPKVNGTTREHISEGPEKMELYIAIKDAQAAGATNVELLATVASKSTQNVIPSRYILKTMLEQIERDDQMIRLLETPGQTLKSLSDTLDVSTTTVRKGLMRLQRLESQKRARLAKEE